MLPVKRPRLVHLIIVTLGALLLASPHTVAEDHWDYGPPQVMVEDLDFPVDLAFGRDGYIYIASLDKLDVRRANVDTGEMDEDFRLEFPDATFQRGTETGLFSIALAEDFHRSGVLYASYSRLDREPDDEDDPGDWTNVLSRVTLHDETGAATKQELLMRPGNEFHNGGRLMIADGHLWWTTGDAIHWLADPEDARVAQEEGNLIGKILRLTLDGEPADGNPWDDHAYTKGHRNVFGIAWDSENERAFITENADGGPDHVMILEAGANYGWPDCEGFCDEPQEEFTDPIWQAETNIAPTGATWFRGAFWWGSFNQGDIYRAHETDDGWVIENVYHYPGTEQDRPVILGVKTGPDDASIWFSTYSEILRMGFPAHDDHPARDADEDGPYWWELSEEDRDVDLDRDPDAGADDNDTPAIGPLIVLGVTGAILAVLRKKRHR